MDTMHKLLLAFVTVIIGAVLIGTIATNTLAITTPTAIGSETFDISSYRLGTGAINTTYTKSVTNAYATTNWLYTDLPSECEIDNAFVLKNGSGVVLTAGNYTMSTKGVLTLANTVALNGTTSNTTTASYTYCKDNYQTNAFGRTSIDLIAGFFALALMAVGVGFFYSVAKEQGIL